MNLKEHCMKQRNCIGVPVDEVLPPKGFKCMLFHHHSIFLRLPAAAKPPTARGEREEERKDQVR
jgi:hypothetical protein